MGRERVAFNEDPTTAQALGSLQRLVVLYGAMTDDGALHEEENLVVLMEEARNAGQDAGKALTRHRNRLRSRSDDGDGG